jgi:hypothetical protein
MKALTYNGQGNIQWTDRPIPNLREPNDVLVRIREASPKLGRDFGASGKPVALHQNTNKKGDLFC